MVPRVATGSVGIIPDFTIVNYRWIINTLVSAMFPSTSGILFVCAIRIAAKPDAKSVSINRSAPHCVFTTVNWNETMNTYATIIAGTQAAPVMPGAAARAGNPRHVQDPASGGIRGAGQYCCRPVSSRTDPNMTALRRTRGMMAVRGMCP
jgi:hypothetical protein